MTAQEALAWFKEELKDGKCSDNCRQCNAYEVAISAIEKQIPKKPDVVDEEYIFEKDEWEKYYECSNCGNPYIDDSFCSCCGQKLDWSDTE